jgi:hypothetical protein
MISLYFSPHRGTREWQRGDFLRLVDNALTLRRYICRDSVSTDFFSSPGSQGTHAAKRLDSDIDFLLKFEQLDHDFKIVCKVLNILYCPLPKRNTSIRTHYSRYYDDELKEIVGKKFGEEIEFGDYSFQDS